MFHSSGLFYLNVLGWDTSSVTNMAGMFEQNNLSVLDLSSWDTRNVVNMNRIFTENAGGIIFQRQLTLGEYFRFAPNFNMGNPPNDSDYTGRWQNVGSGTVDNPRGEFVLTTSELARIDDGAIMANTWVWQRRIANTDIEISVYVNDERLEFDTQPMVVDNHVMIPIRAVSEALGVDIQWIDDWRYVERAFIDATRRPSGSWLPVVSIDYGRVLLQIDNARIVGAGFLLRVGWDHAYVFDFLPVPPRLVNSRTLVPLRAIEIIFRVYAEWDEEAGIVTIAQREEQPIVECLEQNEVPPHGELLPPRPSLQPHVSHF